MSVVQWVDFHLPPQATVQTKWPLQVPQSPIANGTAGVSISGKHGRGE